MAGAFPELVRWVVNIDGLGPPAAALVPPDQIPDGDPAVLRPHGPGAPRRNDGRGRRSRRWPPIERATTRASRPEWALHLARHGSRQVEGGWVWKADPMFGVGIPSEFNVAMLEAEMRHTRCPVLVLTGDQHDTWRELTPRSSRRACRWLGARHEVVAGTGHYVHIEDPDATMARIEAFLAEVGP